MQKREPNQSKRVCVCATLRTAARFVTQAYDEALRPCGLRSTQFNLLYEIRCSGEITSKELTRLLVIDQTTLTRNLALLIRDKLIKTIPTDDARTRLISLTLKGDRIFMRAVPLWQAAQGRMLSKIGLDAWNLLETQLQRLART